MFLGQIPAAIDDKGRVVLPASFKKAMGEMAKEQIVLQMDPFEKCLRIYPDSIFKKEMEAMLFELDPRKESDRKEKIRFFMNVMYASIADNGRINLPQNYIDYCEIKKDVMFVGGYDYIMLWSEEEYENWNKQNLSYSQMLTSKNNKSQ